MINEEDSVLIGNTEDKIRLAFNNFMLTNTHFLDIRQQSLIIKHFQYDKSCNLFLFGGYENAERKMLIISPEYYELNDYNAMFAYFDENTQLCPISALRIKKDRFSPELTHRDYLGALMGLGIKRETVGDIIVYSDGCDIICENKIAVFIKENLSGAGRATVNVIDISLSELVVPDESFDIVYHTVASLRLDAVLSQCYRLSRTKAVEAINKGIVYVNGEQILKTDYKINENDKIVLRGKGKILLTEVLGESQKGRIKINIKIYK